MKFCIVYTITNITASRKWSKHLRSYDLSVELTAFVIRKADNLTAICESIVYKMWEPQRLTILWTPRPVTRIELPY
jgi:hypothetical protein